MHITMSWTIEKKTFHNLIALIKSVLNKDKSNCYYNFFLEKVSYKESNTQYFLKNFFILQMLYHNWPEVSEGTNFKKTGESKLCDISHHWCFLYKGVNQGNFLQSTTFSRAKEIFHKKIYLIKEIFYNFPWSKRFLHSQKSFANKHQKGSLKAKTHSVLNLMQNSFSPLMLF